MNPLDKIRNQITADLATALFKLLHNYPGHEPEMCRLMTGQLGSMIAVSAKDPEKALHYYANILTKIDWQTVRSDYFANTLGVDTTVGTNKPLYMVNQNEPSRPGHVDPVEPDRPEHTGDPSAQKPE